MAHSPLVHELVDYAGDTPPVNSLGEHEPPIPQDRGGDHRDVVGAPEQTPTDLGAAP